MAFGMIHRSEMQVLSVKFWRCTPISVASACTGCAIWPSFARKRARRPRPNTSTCAQYICCAGRRKRAPLRSRTCLLRPQRTPCPCGEPGQTRRRGITVRSRAHIAHKPRVRRLTNGRGSRRRNRLLNGFYRSPVLSLLAPPAPGAPKPCPGYRQS